MVARAGEAGGFPFLIHSHMLRHSCGYKLANDGQDTRAIQHYLGHLSIASTVRYTALYRVPEIVTRGRFPDGGESDSTWRTQRLVMSAPTPLRRDFDAPQVRGLARKTKDGPQARRLDLAV